MLQYLLTTHNVNLWIQFCILLAATAALQQITLAKKNFKLNSKRESIKLAIDFIEKFRNEILKIVDEKTRAPLKSIGYKVYDKELPISFFFLDEISKKDPDLFEHLRETIRKLPNNDGTILKESRKLANSMEYFATPFVTKVADEDVAFDTVGLAFCSIFKEYYFTFLISRKEKDSEYTYYKNAVKLYSIWSQRIERAELLIKKESIQKSIEKLGTESLVPIGTK